MNSFLLDPDSFFHSEKIDTSDINALSFES